jgi:hypothetical protein
VPPAAHVTITVEVPATAPAPRVNCTAAVAPLLSEKFCGA